MRQLFGERNLQGLRRNLSVSELAQSSGLPESQLVELVDYRALTPINPSESNWMFAAHSVKTLRKAAHLRADLALDFDIFALAVTLIGQTTVLEEELDSLRNKMASASESFDAHADAAGRCRPTPKANRC